MPVSDQGDIYVPSKQVWPLKIVAEGIDGADPYIFVYHIGRQPLDPVQGDIFECVATPNQILEIPVGAPGIPADSEIQIPYYRRDVLEFSCHSATEAEYIWLRVQTEVLMLLKNLHASLDLQGSEAVVIADDDYQTAVLASTTTTTTTRSTTTGSTTTTTSTPTTAPPEDRPINLQLEWITDEITPAGMSKASLTWDNTMISSEVTHFQIDVSVGAGYYAVGTVANPNGGATPPATMTWVDPNPRGASSQYIYRVAGYRWVTPSERMITNYAYSQWPPQPADFIPPTTTTTSTSTTTTPTTTTTSTTSTSTTTTPAPSPILNLQAALVNTSTVNLSWTALTGQEENFIRVAIPAFEYDQLLPGNSATHQVTGLTPGTTYTAYVSLVTVDGDSTAAERSFTMGT